MADESRRIMNQQILEGLKKKWKKDIAKEKEEWDKQPGWPAKLVKTEFKLNGIKYTLKPTDIGLEDDCWDQGFMEHIQADLTKDLKKAGATDIYNTGYID